MKIIEKVTQAALNNQQVVIVVTAALLVFGTISLFVMPRQEFPEFVVRQGIIVGVFPGASSVEVEERLTTKVENFLFSYEEVDRNKTYSISEEGMMYIFVEVRGDVEDADLFWATLRHGLQELKAQLPQEVLALIANNKFGDASALLLTLQSDRRTYKELEEYLNVIEEEIRKLPSVSAIKHYGLQREVINIYFDNEKMASYGINPYTLFAMLRMENSVTYAGNIDDGKVSMPVHLPDRYETEKDLAEQIVYTDPRGVVVRLKDVARVVREYEEPDSYVQIDGNNCIVLSLEMMNGNNIVKFGKDIDKILEQTLKTLPPDLQINTIADMPQAVDEAVTVFLHEFVVAILAVIIVTMILLPFRVSSIAALTIPITILVTMGLLYMRGIELHTVSLAALIVVLGMVVDNTIVIIDNYVEQLDQGIDPWKAAWQSVAELFIPVFSATLAIIAVFVPMTIFLTGLPGDFVKPFPDTIIITLGVSLLVAVLIVPILSYTMIKTGLHSQKDETKKKKISMLDRMQNSYNRMIEFIFKHKGMILLGSVLLLALTGVVGSKLTSKFGPVVDRDQFAVEIYLAEGTSLDLTAKACEDLQNVLLQDPRVEHVTAFVGTSSPRFHSLYAPNMPGENYAQLIVNTVSVKATKEVVAEYGRTYKSSVPEAFYRWKQLEFTKSIYPIEIRISGDNISDLKSVGERVEQIIRDTGGASWIRTDYREPLPGIKVLANEDEANRLGLTKAMIAYTIASGVKGLPLATVWEGDYPVNIVLRQEASEKTDVEDLKNMYISSPFSPVSVRARQVARIEPEWTEGAIIRRNGRRTLTVCADVKLGEFAYRIFNEIKPQIEGLDLPDGVSIAFGGDHETEIETYTPFVYSLITSIVVIFFILLFQFKTVRLSMLIMSIVPFSAFGALVGLLLFRYPFGMTAFIGIISLVGMVIRNGVIYVDYAEHLRNEQGMPLNEAALAAAKRRLRPIFLTSMAAAVGVIPMIISRSPLWGPLGAVVCFGMLFTMVITLIVLPVLYTVFGPGKKASVKGLKPVLTAMVILSLSLLAGFNQAQAQSALTLEQAKQFALENSIELRNAQEEVRAARHVKRSAFTGYFPEVSATGMVMKMNDPLVDFKMDAVNLPVYDGNPANLLSPTEFAYFPGLSLNAGEDVLTGAVTAVQPVFAGGRIFNGNRLASIGVDVRETQRELAEKDVLIKTEQQYWQLVSLNEKLKTIEAYETLLLDLEEQVLDAWNAGLVLENDVLKVQLKLSEIQLNKSKLLNGKKLATMAFCQYIGMPYDSTMTLASSIDDMEAETLRHLDHAAALESRGEYRLLQKSVKASKLQTNMAIGENMPTVAVGLAEFYMKVDDYDHLDNAVGFVAMQIPISGWWGGSHKIAEHKAHQRIAENRLEDSEELLLLQMDKTWQDYTEAQDQYKLSLQTQQQVQTNVRVTKSAYDNGVVDVSDLLEAQALLQEANDRVIEARIDLRMKKLQYLQATGKL